MKPRHAIPLFLVGVLASHAVAESLTATVKIQKSVDYPQAGIILAVPTGFSFSPLLSQEYQVMVASRIEGRRASQSVSLSAYPVAAGVTPERFLQELRKPLESNLAVRQLKVVKTTKVPVAGLVGAAAHLTYTFRGIKTVAVSACFIRDVTPTGPATKPDDDTRAGGGRLAYVLTLEVAEAHRKTLLRTFDAIVRTIMITLIERPIDIEKDYDGPYLRDFPRGYALRMPKGWIGGQNALGVFMEQADYKLGGIPCPSVQVVSNLVPPSMSAEACGAKAIEWMKKNGVTVEILSKGPAKMAKRDGYQYVIRKTQTPKTNKAKTPPLATTTIEVHRLLCVLPSEEDEEERARHYTLIVAGQDATVKQMTELADNLAQHFLVVPIPEEY